MNLDFQDAQRGPKKRGSKKTGLQSQFLEFVPRAEAAGRGKEEETGRKSPAREQRGVARKRKQAEKAPLASTLTSLHSLSSLNNFTVSSAIRILLPVFFCVIQCALGHFHIRPSALPFQF